MQCFFQYSVQPGPHYEDISEHDHVYDCDGISNDDDDNSFLNGCDSGDDGDNDDDDDDDDDHVRRMQASALSSRA